MSPGTSIYLTIVTSHSLTVYITSTSFPQENKADPLSQTYNLSLHSYMSFPKFLFTGFTRKGKGKGGLARPLRICACVPLEEILWLPGVRGDTLTCRPRLDNSPKHLPLFTVTFNHYLVLKCKSSHKSFCRRGYGRVDLKGITTTHLLP